MIKDNNVLMAKNGDKEFVLLSKMANRHGLIAGATGSGKTVTLKVMAEGFSAIGVPVFLSDVKGDLAGMCKPGVDNENMQERIQRFNISDSFKYQSFPAEFYDINRKNGLPIRTTISGARARPRENRPTTGTACLAAPRGSTWRRLTSTTCTRSTRRSRT